MTTTLTSKPARTLDSWDTNYPTTRKIYRSDSGMYGSMVFSDVRTFIHSDDYVIKDTIALRMFRTSHDAVQSMSDEEKVIAIHKYAIDNFKYVGDDKSSKTVESWRHPDVTQAIGSGDCEDGAFWIASALINSGVDPRRVRCNAGSVAMNDGSTGGHMWVTYLCPDNIKWIILDWCYWPKAHKSLSRYPDSKSRKCRSYKGIWFSFNNLHCWDPSDVATSSWEGRLHNPESTATQELGGLNA